MRYHEIHHRSISEREAFWEQESAAIDWLAAPETILSQDEQGFYRWFAGGKLNTCHLALDR
ncbi:MAG: acetyl-coenzyme A synthetase N-terminal domain-containing protein, partial [Saprospiraceae bacterium]